MDVMVAFCPLAHLQFMLSVHLIFVLVDTWLTDLGKKWFMFYTLARTLISLCKLHWEWIFLA